MLVADVTVTELHKARTHTFAFYQAGNMAVVEGGFVINGQEWPGKILYTDDQTILVKPNPDQCITFPPAHLVYGFLPPDALDTTAYEVSNITYEAGLPVTYTLFDYDTQQSAIVEFDHWKTKPFSASHFEIPAIDCFSDMITI